VVLCSPVVTVPVIGACFGALIFGVVPNGVFSFTWY